MTRTAFLFPGQGAQKLGMSADLLAEYPSCEAVFEASQEALGRDIRDVMFGLDADALNETNNTQVCLLAAELCSWTVACESGFSAEACIGFSLGEWTALVATGVIDMKTAFRVVQQRAYAMQRAVPLGKGGMVAVLGQSDETVESICEEVGGIWPSNYNCAGQVTVAGTRDSVDKLIALCGARDINNVPLTVSVPSHCPLMESASQELEKILGGVLFHDAAFPIMMNATGEAVRNADDIKHNMVLQLTRPVRFSKAVGNLIEGGFDTFIELGPGRVLSKLVKHTSDQAATFRVSDLRTLQKTLDALL